MSFSPYQDNGGTVVAVAGKDFAVIGSDTRVSQGYSIHTRTGSKMAVMSDTCVMGSSGMQADRATLQKTLKIRMIQYKAQHKKEMSTNAFAQMLSNTLYYRRFFPYYTFNLVAGVDSEGKGVVYGYDAIGSYEESGYGATGSGASLTQPLLDNQIGKKNQAGVEVEDLPVEEVVALVRDALSSATERDIYTGDFVEIAIITSEGVRTERHELKFD